MALAASFDVALVTLAQEAGGHALGGFAMMLTMVATAAWTIAWFRLSASHRRSSELAQHPERAAVGHLLSLALCAMAAFAVIAWGTRAGGEFVRVDHALSAAVHDSATAATLDTFGWIAWLGDGRTLATLCICAVIAMLLQRERMLALGLVVAMGGNGLLNGVLKHIFARLRPAHEHALAGIHGWGFPSAHASGAVVAYGILAYVLLRKLPRMWHLPIVVLAAAMPLAIGASRIFIDAHYVSDVLAGFASGTAWLVICMAALERRSFRFPRGPARAERILNA